MLFLDRQILEGSKKKTHTHPEIDIPLFKFRAGILGKDIYLTVFISSLKRYGRPLSFGGTSQIKMLGDMCWARGKGHQRKRL